MGDNLKIRKLRESLVECLNASTLPIEVKRMVLKEALDSATTLADQQIKLELEAETRKENENVVQ